MYGLSIARNKELAGCIIMPTEVIRVGIRTSFEVEEILPRLWWWGAIGGSGQAVLVGKKYKG